MTTPQDPAQILQLQAPTGLPTSDLLTLTSDPISPAQRAASLLAHFFPGVYDLGSNSHLTRFLKVLLGDAGIGQLRKRYIVSHLQSVILTTHFADLDRFYGSLFGFRRLFAETLAISPYIDNATPEEWADITARDSAYRNRIESFSRALQLGPTPDGMAAVASALLGGVECQIYESYLLVDENTSPTGGNITGSRTYFEVERTFVTYGAMRSTYSDIEGGHFVFGQTTINNRGEFVVRPKRPITMEETYELTRVLSRLKPVQALMSVDSDGVQVNTPIVLRAVAADSTLWEVSSKVAPASGVTDLYQRQPTTPGVPVSQPRPAFTGYQGEAWSYNSDVVKVVSYTEDSGTHLMEMPYDYQRIVRPNGQVVDFGPDRAVADPVRILLGRSVSDGILTASPYSRVAP